MNDLQARLDAASAAVRTVQLYTTTCFCEPPGHDRSCRGGQQKAGVRYEFGTPEDASFVIELLRAGRLAVVPDTRRGTECNQSHDGRHHIDTSMEEGPHHCFHCGTDMRITQSETHDVD